MLEYMKFEKKHIPAVKELFDKYLIPNYLRRMGITKEELTDDIIKFETILDPEVTSEKYYQQYSMVCVDRNLNDKVVGCYMCYPLDEAEYNESLVDSAKRYLLLKNQPESVRSYAKALIRSNEGLNIFQEYNLKKILYIETVIIDATYRGNEIIKNFFHLSRDRALKDNNISAILSETQIPPEVWKGRREVLLNKRPITNDNRIILRENVDNGFLCLTVLRILEKPSSKSML